MATKQKSVKKVGKTKAAGQAKSNKKSRTLTSKGKKWVYLFEEVRTAEKYAGDQHEGAQAAGRSEEGG